MKVEGTCKGEMLVSITVLTRKSINVCHCITISSLSPVLIVYRINLEGTCEAFNVDKVKITISVHL